MITARYSIWEHSNQRERSGTPAKVAREIKQTVEQTPAKQLPRYDWVIDHVWSFFKESPGTDEDAENIATRFGSREGGVRRYRPAEWCAERLPADIRVVSPEELAWRIRMQHNPVQTNTLIRGRNWLFSLGEGRHIPCHRAAHKFPLFELLRRDGIVGPDAQLQPLSGGVSSEILLIENDGPLRVVKRALSTLRVADVWNASVSRNEFEQRYLNYVSRFLPDSVPTVLASGDGYFVMPYFDATFTRGSRAC